MTDLQTETRPAPLVHIEGLKKDYHLGGRHIEVLRGINLDVFAGERISIVGKSGVGKSTFLHLVGTLDKPTEGKILFEGENVFSLSESRLANFRNRSIGFVFQFHYLLPDFTAFENVGMPLRIAGVPASEIEKRSRELLEQVDLADRMHHRPGELSGGEQQRVAIARALAYNPKILLADEPTGNLDETTSTGIHDLLVELNRTHQTTVVIVTHNPRLASRMDRQLEMIEGGITEHVSRNS